MTAEEQLAALDIDLSLPGAPVANYVPLVRTGNLVFLSGSLPVRPDGSRIEGKVGADLSLEEAQDAARLATIGLLARLRGELGSLDEVTRVVKVTGYVNAPADFTLHPQVVNGASDLLVQVFGEAGRHARAAVGVASLPFNVPVEVEMVVEVA